MAAGIGIVDGCPGAVPARGWVMERRSRKRVGARLSLAYGMGKRKRITIGTLRARKRESQRISMLTCYDFATARLMEEAEVDSLLVGDTYGEVCLGYSTTLPVTIEHMVTLAEAVRRGAPTAYLVCDMRYLTFHLSAEEAIRHAGLFMAK